MAKHALFVKNFGGELVWKQNQLNLKDDIIAYFHFAVMWHLISSIHHSIEVYLLTDFMWLSCLVFDKDIMKEMGSLGVLGCTIQGQCFV